MKKLSLSVFIFISVSVLGYGIGQSTYPLKEGDQFFSTEFTGITSDDGGVGVQARLTRKINQEVTIEGGLGVSGGDREQRFFLGVDYELYPDYLKQPRFSLKCSLERAQEFEVARNLLIVTPIISKGVNFWGKEAFPYVAIPFGLSLNSDNKSYESVMSLNVGINGKLPVKNFKEIKANFELQLGLSNSFTAFLVGFSFPVSFSRL